MKYRVILFLTIAVAAVFGACFGEYLAASNIPLVSWLGYHKSFGFDGVSIDWSFMQLKFSLRFDLYVIQAFLLLLAVYVAPRIDAAVKW